MKLRNSLIAFIISLLFIIGCGIGSEHFGEDITETKTTAIGDILKSPQQYEGKIVKLKGKIIRECPTGCWFDLKDDSGVIYTDLNPSNFAIPQVVNKNIVAEGKVKLKGKNVVIIGKGVKIE